MRLNIYMLVCLVLWDSHLSVGQYCLYKGNRYFNGQSWVDGCDFNCTCVEETTGRYRCYSFCPIYTYIPDGCTMEREQGDCCDRPNCPRGVSATLCQDKIDSCDYYEKECTNTGPLKTWMKMYCPSFCSLCKPYVIPTTTVSPSPPVHRNSKCVYKGKEYTVGQRWTDGCNFSCECLDGENGIQSNCTRMICPDYGPLPGACHFVTDMNNPCCNKLECASVVG